MTDIYRFSCISRVETDPHPISRTEVLSMPDTANFPEVQQPAVPSARGDHGDDIAEEFRLLADKQRYAKNRKRPFNTIEEMNKKIMRRESKTVTGDPSAAETTTIDMATTENEMVGSAKDKSVNVKTKHANNRKPLSLEKRNESVYLSMKNLKEHERIMEHKKTKDTTHVHDPAKKHVHKHGHVKDKHYHTLGHTKGETKDKQDENMNSGETAEKLFKPAKHRKHRRLPPVSGVVQQRSRAESYRSIYMRRQKVALELAKDSQITVRRIQSASNGINNTNLPDEMKKPNFKTKPVRGGDDEDPHEKSHRAKFRRDSETYFTRSTKDRYLNPKSDLKTDAPMGTRSMVDRGTMPGQYISQYHRGSVTERSGQDRKKRRQVKERIMWDKEREDMYMKEVDMFTVATKEARENRSDRESNLDREEIVTSHNNQKQKGFPKHALSSSYDTTDERNEPKTQDSDPMNTADQRFKHTGTVPTAPPTHAPQPNVGDGMVQQQQQQQHQQPWQQQQQQQQQQQRSTYGDSLNAMNRSGRRKSSLKEAVLPSPGNTPRTVESEQDIPGSTEPSTQQRRGSITPLTSRSNDTRATASKPINLIISSEIASDGSQNAAQGQSVKATPRDGPETNGPAAPDSITPRADDVVIRDKLTVEINVQDRDREPSNITREKAKIRRFWEVVGGKEVENEEELYGEANQTDNEKILMTKVKKERKMSAKSKSSKQTETGNMTSKKIGKYNVTVEVA